MIQPIEIPIKATGLAAVKAELRALKGELINATNPADIERLTAAAGKLSDKLSDANARVKAFATDSKFEGVANGLGLVGTNLKNLDFGDAKENAKLLAANIKSMNPEEIRKGFSDFTSTIGILSKSFFQLGLTILANPIFLIVAIITVVVVAIVLLRDKIKILGIAFDYMMIPIKALIQGLKDLGDWLGLTSFAEQEAADKSVAATEKRIGANKKATSSVDKEFANQIALMKANGEETTNVEIQRAQTAQNASAKNSNAYNKQIADLKERNKNAADEDVIKNNKIINASRKLRDEENVINADSIQKIKELITGANFDERTELEKHNKEKADKQVKHNEKLAKIQKDFDDDVRQGIKLNDKEIEDNDKKIKSTIQEATQKNSDNKKSAEQIEIDNTKANYATKIADADKAGMDTAQLLEAQKLDLFNIDNKYRSVDYDETKANADAKEQLEIKAQATKEARFKASFGLLKQASNLLGETTDAGKAAAIAIATIDTYQSAVASYKSFAGTGPYGPALGFAAAGIAVASGLANVQKIISVKTPKGGGGGGSAPSGGGGGGSTLAPSSSPLVPATNLIGNRNEGNNAGPAGTVNGLTGQVLNINAIVSETEVTDTQNRITKIKNSAEL